MTQHGLDHEFHHMTITDQRKQLSPSIARKPQPQVPTAYRPGPAPYQGYRDPGSSFPPPPPPAKPGYIDQNFPPPPPETKENIYHEIQDEFPPPPPPPGPPAGGRGQDFRGPEPMHVRGYPGQSAYGSSRSSYETRQVDVIAPPNGPYERVVKQATYSVQSSDSSGRSSPYGSQYANVSGISTNTYGGVPTSQTYSGQTYGSSQYGSKPRSASPVQYYPGSQSNEESTVTYAQIKPRTERPIPGPQVPIQIKVADKQHSPSATGSVNKSGKEAEVDALTSLLMQNMESSADPDFFGICCKCGKKVVGESNGCSAMDQVFHIACFICVNCGELLRGKSFYAMERKPYCEPCYMNTLEKCSICSKPITDRLLRATGKPYHPACFTCVVCGKTLDGVPFTVDATNQIHCIEDFHKKFAPRCCVCHQPIMPDRGQEETVRVVAMDKSFHVQCYRCEDCGMLLSSEAEGRGCYPLDDHILCKNCNAKRINAMTTKLATEL